MDPGRLISNLIWDQRKTLGSPGEASFRLLHRYNRGHVGPPGETSPAYYEFVDNKDKAHKETSHQEKDLMGIYPRGPLVS